MILIKAYCQNGASMYKTVKDSLDTHGMAVMECLSPPALELALAIAETSFVNACQCERLKVIW